MRIVFVNRQKWPSQTPSSAASSHNAHALASLGIPSHLLVGKGEVVSKAEA